MVTLLIFLAVLFVLVLAHEFGHFYIAKRAGVRVDEFGISFPPRLFGVWRDPATKKFHLAFGRRGAERATSTLYSFNLIPLGGFVKIKGEDGQNAEDEDSFAHKRAGTRAWILCAGVLMNVVATVVFLSVGFTVGMPTSFEDREPGRFAQVADRKLEIIYVYENSPAASASLQAGDSIVSVDELSDIHFNSVRDYLGSRDGQDIMLGVVRNGEPLTVTVRPEYFPEAGRSAVGIGLAETGIVSYPWYLAPLKGVEATGVFTVEIFKAFGSLIGSLARGEDTGQVVAGPVGIAVITGQAARLGFAHLLQFMALLSLNLAILNILPIPALDGGRLLFVIIEKVRRGKKTRQEVERLTHLVGFAALIALVLVVTFNDLGNYSEQFKNFVERLK